MYGWVHLAQLFMTYRQIAAQAFRELGYSEERLNWMFSQADQGVPDKRVPELGEKYRLLIDCEFKGDDSAIRQAINVIKENIGRFPPEVLEARLKQGRKNN